MSEKRSIVSDTGPLISLERIEDGYAFVRRLYDNIILPHAVLEEVSRGQFNSSAEYLQYYRIEDLIDVKEPDQTISLPGLNRLHQGEKEAILLARELDLPLLIEETIGRQIAKASNLVISGIAGVVLRAYRENIISIAEAEDKLKDLRLGGRINRVLYDALLKELMDKGT